jgi:hypothetical protein
VFYSRQTGRLIVGRNITLTLTRGLENRNTEQHKYKIKRTQTSMPDRDSNPREVFEQAKTVHDLGRMANVIVL